MRQLEKLDDTGFLSYIESPLYRPYITVISGYRKIKSHFFLLYYEAYTKHMNVAFNIFLNLHKPMWKKKVFKKNFFRGFNASFSTTHYWWGNISKVFDHQSIFDGIFLLYHLYCARKLWKTSQNVRMKSNLILARFLVSAKK